MSQDRLAHLWRVRTEGVAPLWRQCATHIETLIRDGTLKPGEALPAHTELARRTGVGASTLQKALVWLTTENLLVRHRRRGTFVAKNPKGGRTAWVAVVTRAMFDPALSQWDLLCARALVETLTDAGQSFRFYHNAYLPDKPDAFQQELDPRLSEDVASGRVAGVLVIGAIPTNHPEFREQLKSARVPMVETSERGTATPYVVTFDRCAFVRAAVQRAARRGCRRLALIETPGFVADGHDRLAETFEAAVSEQGVAAAKDWLRRIAWPPGAAKGAAAFQSLWQDGASRPDAIVVTDEYVAQGVAQAAQAMDVDVPADVYLIAQVNRGTGISYPVPVDTIEFDPLELIRGAWNMLRERMRGQVVNRRLVRIGPCLPEGEVTRPTSAGQPAVEEVAT